LEINNKYIRFVGKKEEEENTNSLDVIILYRNLVFFAINSVKEKNDEDESKGN
jgi:hypothetical protein